jgi:cell division protein FtsI (penicillin-binding protein 3)
MSISDSARQIPGVAAAEGAISGALATEDDLPIADYDKQTAEDNATRLKGFSQRELRTIDAYERKRENRATITDRNGQVLAISLPMAAVYANPLELIDPADAAAKLKTVLPKLDVADIVRRLSQKKQFVYLARDIPPDKELAINDLGIPGIYFEPGEKRHYPLGRAAAQIMGAVDIDDHGVAGVERSFDKRLNTEHTPLRLSLDVRVQGVVREELAASKDKFSAIGACAIVMDVRTGEIVAMVSLPDYDISDPASLKRPALKPGQTYRQDLDPVFNRATVGVYEPGSTFKLLTAAMALDSGTVNIWNGFDASKPIRYGRFQIDDY